jgi:hypothetical protein
MGVRRQPLFGPSHWHSSCDKHETRQWNEHTAQMLAQSSPAGSLKRSLVGHWCFGQFTTPRLKGNICRRIRYESVHMHRQESEPCPK